MQFDFTGYKVVVTGGSKGIGRGIALAFFKAGAAVSICARNEQALRATQADMAEDREAHAEVCDLGDEAAVGAYVTNAAHALGGIDVLVNNASGFGRTDDEAGWAAAIGIDLMATLRASWMAIPWLEQSGRGSLIHITSTGAFKPSVLAPPYAAIKAALIHYTRTQAKQLAATGIRVNSVAPGSTEAPGHFYETRRLANDPSYERTRSTFPRGKLGTPAEIADVVMFLASPAARWVTAQTIIADGGQHLFDNM